MFGGNGEVWIREKSGSFVMGLYVLAMISIVASLAALVVVRPRADAFTFSRKTPQRLMRRFTRALVMSSEGHLDLNFASCRVQIGGAHMCLAREQPATSRLVRLRYA